MDRQLEAERWIEILKRRIAALESQLAALAQQLRAMGTGGAGNGDGGVFAKYAITSSTIGAGGDGTLGRGTATLQDVTRDDNGDATYTDSTDGSVDVYNGGGSVDNGQLIQIKRIDGCWNVDVAYC